MNLKPNEIDSINDIGTIDNEPVKLIKTKGGFWAAVKSGKNTEVVAHGSHPAIVKYSLQKNYKTYSPLLTKSEEPEEIATGLSELLHPALYSEGYDLYSLKKNSDHEMDYVFEKDGNHILTLSGTQDDKSLTITSVTCSDAQNTSKYISSVAEALKQELDLNGKTVKVDIKK